MPLGTPRRPRLSVAGLTAALVLGAALAVAGSAAAQPVAAAPRVLDGPLVTPSGLAASVARDGSGGLVYLKRVGGVAHVFVSTLIGGVFQAPVQVDGALAGSSSQPVIAAGNGGELIVAFVNGGGLYVVQRASVFSRLGGPRGLAGGASNPSLQMTPFGKAYLAFAVADGAGSDVRAAYYHAGAWALESAPLNQTPADDAGTGSGRPAVAAAGDGVGIVAWGENGHVLTRRVWATAPSVVLEQADGPLGGCSELGADEPAIGSGGDSSYAAVAFHAQLVCGGQTQSRVLENRLHGSQFDGVVPADGLATPAGDGADYPAVVAAEYGRGWVTSQYTGSGNAYGLHLDGNETPAGVQQINSLPDASRTFVTPAVAGLNSSVIVWQHDPGLPGAAEIRLRLGDIHGTLSPEMVLSSPGDGPTDAADGLAVDADVVGDVAAAWVQQTTSGPELVSAQLYQPPGAPGPQAPTGYLRSLTPRLAWVASPALWGPIQYTVSLDGAQLAVTAATSMRVGPLSQGPHTWQIVAANPVGLTSGGRTGRFFVDTVPPRATLTLSGPRRAGSLLRLHVVSTDAPAPLPSADASGVALVVVHWGDGNTDVIHHWRLHAYRRPGRYRIRVVVSDRAGNVATVSMLVRVRPKPKPKTAPGGKSGGSGSGSAGLPPGKAGH